MGRNSGFLYEALRARSGGSTSQRVGRSAASAGRGMFGWISDRASDATSAVTGRKRRRGSSPDLMVLAVALGVLGVGFLLGRWSTGFGGSSESALSTRAEPGFPLPESRLRETPVDHCVALLRFSDEEFDLAMRIARSMSKKDPSVRLLSGGRQGERYHALIVSGSEDSMRRLTQRLNEGKIANPVPLLLDESRWRRAAEQAMFIGLL